jgi:hypothetical protein
MHVLPHVNGQITCQRLCKRCQKFRDEDWIAGDVIYERRVARHGEAWSVDEPVGFCFGPFAEDEEEVFHLQSWVASRVVEHGVMLSDGDTRTETGLCIDREQPISIIRAIK